MPIWHQLGLWINLKRAARVADASQPGGTTIEDLVELDDGYSRGEPPSPNTAANLCRSNTSASIHAMLRVSKQEREELISTRRKLMDVLNFMKQKGYSEEQMLADLVDDGFLRPLCERDDYGLPDLGSKLRSSTDIPAKKDPVDQVLDKSPELNPFTDKMKAKVPGDVPEGLAQGHLDSSPPPQVPVVNKPVQDKPKLGEKSWSQVLNGSTSKAPPISFDFIKESVGACPRASKHWVPKAPPSAKGINSNGRDNPPPDLSEAPEAGIDTPKEPPLAEEEQTSQNIHEPTVADETWTTVTKRKKKEASPVKPVSLPEKSVTGQTPSAAPISSNLPIYSALSRSLSRNQRKKAKNSGGKPPSAHH
ncbi:hypothetical protein ACET3Z_001676 [Daucus carota]